MFKYGTIALVFAMRLSLSTAAPAPTPAAKPAPAAAKPAAAPKPAPKPAPGFQATVVSVSGPAQKLLIGTGQKKWQKLAVGDKLGPLSVIRTGLGAEVVLKFEDRGQVTVNNATKIGIRELEKKGPAAKARLGLKYGTLRARVDKKHKSDFQIATPVATLSVRGSEGDVGYMVDSEAFFRSLEGFWQSDQPEATGTGTTTTHTSTHTAGETATIGVDPPIIFIVKNYQQAGGGVNDPYGTTGNEQQSLDETGSTGKRGPNTPTGGSGTTTGGTGDTVPSEPVEPGHP